LVGFVYTVQANKKINSSPLFAVRTQRAAQTIPQDITTVFIGKEKQINIFPATTQNQGIINKAIQFFRSNPAVLTKLVDKLDAFPYSRGLLAAYGISKIQIKNYMKILQENPSLAWEQINGLSPVISPEDSPPQPLGLSTSNALACFIMGLIVLVPLTAYLTLLSLVFTLRILTCLNVNDCGDIIVKNIWDQLVQGLTPG
jgi:hypothetical protein